MLMKAEPVALALESLRPVEGAAIVLTDPAGDRFEQRTAEDLAQRPEVVFLCGHYEGVDARVESLCTHFLSIGDFVLTGGELPSLVMADAVVRLLPGVLGSDESLRADSFAEGILSAPNYTRPETWRGMSVPEVLRSGDHARVAAPSFGPVSGEEFLLELHLDAFPLRLLPLGQVHLQDSVVELRPDLLLVHGLG